MDKIEIIFKNKSLNNFLKSIAAFSDRVIIEEKNNQLIATTFVDQCIYRGIYKNVIFNKNTDDSIKLNIPDVKNLQKIVDNISEENIKFRINNNNLTYSSKTFKTKYVLLEDGIISSCKLNIDRALNLNWDIEFNVNRENFANLISLTSLSNLEQKKLYFYTNNSCLYCDIGDKTKINTNELTSLIIEGINFDLSGIIIPAEIIRIINTAPYKTINIKINKERFIVLFTIDDEDYISHYIVAGREE